MPRFLNDGQGGIPEPASGRSLRALLGNWVARVRTVLLVGLVRPALGLSILALAACVGLDGQYRAPDSTDQLRYDYMDDEYEYAGPKEELRYNHLEDRYEYAEPDETLPFDYMDGEYEYAK